MHAAITIEDAARRHERLAASHDRQRVPPNGGWTLIVRIPVDVRAARREQAMIGGRHGRGKLPAALAIVRVERIRPAIFHHRRGDAPAACPRERHARGPIGIVVEREGHGLELPVDGARPSLDAHHAQPVIWHWLGHHSVAGVSRREQDIVAFSRRRVPDPASSDARRLEIERWPNVAGIRIERDQLAILDQRVCPLVSRLDHASCGRHPPSSY